jgi:hypothetical protein
VRPFFLQRNFALFGNFAAATKTHLPKRKSALRKAEPTKSRGNKDHQAAAQPMARK